MKKCLPDLTTTTVVADVNVRYVAAAQSTAGSLVAEIRWRLSDEPQTIEATADGVAQATSSEPVERILLPGTPPEWALIQCDVFEVFFGGARGGGKSDAMLGDWMFHADAYGENASGLMIRRTYVELADIIERSRVLYTPLGWRYNETEKTWRDPRGARLKFAYLDRDSDAEGYQGHSYTKLYVEEAGKFPSPAPIFKMFATLRSGAGVPVSVRLTGNPGGPGHQWVKMRYIDAAPLGNRIIRDPATGLERIYIPSRVGNNPHIDVRSLYPAVARGRQQGVGGGVARR